MELLCELCGVGDRRRINWFWVEAILYIDVVERVVWKAINRCWGGRYGKGDIKRCIGKRVLKKIYGLDRSCFVLRMS